MNRLSVSSVAMLGAERQYVDDALVRGELSWHGEYVRRFEDRFARYCAVPEAVSCCNGTAALHLALLAMGIGPGDVVYLPALSFVATANAVSYVGATPVFCDIDHSTWCLDPRDVEAQISQHQQPWRKREAILPVHLYGMPADMVALRSIAETYGVSLIEDAAEAHGASVGGLCVGSLGDVAAFSFFANKMLTTGEGGMVTTSDASIAQRVRHLRGQCQTERRYYHDAVGYNYRLTNLSAAIGLAQVETAFLHEAKRNAVVLAYQRYLSKFEQQRAPDGTEPAPWLYTMLLPHGVDREAVMASMDADGIETRPTFIPLTDLPPYRGQTPPVAADVGARGLSLPTHAAMDEEDVYRVVLSLLKAVDRA